MQCPHSRRKLCARRASREVALEGDMGQANSAIAWGLPIAQEAFQCQVGWVWDEVSSRLQKLLRIERLGSRGLGLLCGL